MCNAIEYGETKPAESIMRLWVDRTLENPAQGGCRRGKIQQCCMNLSGKRTETILMIVLGPTECMPSDFFVNENTK